MNLVYRVKLIDMPYEFLTRETESVLKTVTSFLESLLWVRESSHFNTFKLPSEESLRIIIHQP